MTPVGVSELGVIPGFNEVPRGELEWFAAQLTVRDLSAGEPYHAQGDPAPGLQIVLRGLLQLVRQEAGKEVGAYLLEPGEMSGRLPFSRMRVQGTSATALSDTRIAELAAERFPDLGAHAPFAVTRDLDRLAPSHLDLPSGRRTALVYEADGTVSASAKLQELFGLAETPRVGSASVPVVLSLLAPNGRPVQTTRDLPAFWAGSWREVAKEMRGRYPRHPWPDDPAAAPPTLRTKRASS